MNRTPVSSPYVETMNQFIDRLRQDTPELIPVIENFCWEFCPNCEGHGGFEEAYLYNDCSICKGAGVPAHKIIDFMQQVGVFVDVKRKQTNGIS